MEKLKLTGFHATSKENVNNIVTDTFIINRKRNNDWLGHGIYLFMYKVDADSWAKGTYYCRDNPAIIKCFIEVERDKYLDLDNPEEMHNYDSYYNEVLQLLTKEGKSVVFKTRHEAMCWGLNLYKVDKNIDAVKYTFINNRTKNTMKYGNNKYGYKYNEVQICITRNEIIVEKELCS